MMKVMWVTQGIPRGASDIWLGTHSDASVWCSICTWHRHEKAHNDCNAEFYHTVVHLCRFQKVSDKILWHQKRASTTCIHTSNDPHTTHNKSGTKVGPHLCSVILSSILYISQKKKGRTKVGPHLCSVISVYFLSPPQWNNTNSSRVFVSKIRKAGS